MSEAVRTPKTMATDITKAWVENNKVLANSTAEDAAAYVVTFYSTVLAELSKNTGQARRVT